MQNECKILEVMTVRFACEDVTIILILILILIIIIITIILSIIIIIIPLMRSEEIGRMKRLKRMCG